MTITYYPTDVLKRIAPRDKIERLVKKDISINRAMLSVFDKADFINKERVTEAALSAIKKYEEKYGKLRREKVPKAEALSEAVNDSKLLVQRVENAVVNEIADSIRTAYDGEKYEWLPSDAEEPDPLHQLNYGKIFTVGDGEMPGDRYGCKCGMRILVKGSDLELD